MHIRDDSCVIHVLGWWVFTHDGSHDIMMVVNDIVAKTDAIKPSSRARVDRSMFTGINMKFVIDSVVN